MLVFLNKFPSCKACSVVARLGCIACDSGGTVLQGVQLLLTMTVLCAEWTQVYLVNILMLERGLCALCHTAFQHAVGATEGMQEKPMEFKKKCIFYLYFNCRYTILKLDFSQPVETVAFSLKSSERRECICLWKVNSGFTGWSLWHSVMYWSTQCQVKICVTRF